MKEDRVSDRLIRRFAPLVIVAGLLGTAPAGAMTLQCGPNVCYEYDETQSGVALFGLPTLVGDALRFLPTSFLAESADGAGTVTTSTTFVFSRVFTVAGGEIQGVDVREEGDYEVIGDGSVSATLNLGVENNFNGTETTSTSSVFSQTGDSAGMDTWLVSADSWPMAAFADPASDVQVTIENILQAISSAPGEYAFIQKKFIMETQWLPAGQAVVPLPAAAGLLVSALGALGALRRRVARV